MHEYMKLLGMPAKDKITKFEGVVECVSFDLYGCVQVAIKPTAMDKEGKIREGHWFDHKRVEVLAKKPVMAVPDFTLASQAAVSSPKARIGNESGPAEKPGGRCR